MKKQLVMLFSALVAATLPGILAFAESPENKPLKIIAPDLIIESAEQGAFYDTKYASAQSIDPLNFKRLNVIPRPHSFMFGWRMKVKTTRTSILVQERTADGKGKQGLPFHATPKFGYICNCTDIVEGMKPGKDSTTVYVEKVPVITFTATIK